MSCALFTAIGLVSTYVTNPNNLIRMSTYGAAGVFLFVAILMTLHERNRELKQDNEGLKANSLASRMYEDNLRLELRESINRHRPELFANYLSDLIFEEEEHDSWNPEPPLFCARAINLVNEGRSTAFDVRLLPIRTKAFLIEFTNIPKLRIGEPAYLDAHLYPIQLQASGQGRTWHNATQQGEESVFYESVPAGHPLKVKVGSGLTLEATWRDRSNHYFRSVSKSGNHGPVEQIPEPLAEDSTLAASEDDGVT